MGFEEKTTVFIREISSLRYCGHETMSDLSYECCVLNLVLVSYIDWVEHNKFDMGVTRNQCRLTFALCDQRPPLYIEIFSQRSYCSSRVVVHVYAYARTIAPL